MLDSNKLARFSWLLFLGSLLLLAVLLLVQMRGSSAPPRLFEVRNAITRAARENGWRPVGLATPEGGSFDFLPPAVSRRLPISTLEEVLSFEQGERRLGVAVFGREGEVRKLLLTPGAARTEFTWVEEAVPQVEVELLTTPD